MRNININTYPALNSILWDYHSKTIPADEAFKIYENRWCFVDKANLAKKEQNLIDRLANEYGNGYFLPTRS